MTFTPKALRMKPAQGLRDKYGQLWKEFRASYPRRQGGQNMAYGENLFYALLDSGEDGEGIIAATKVFCEQSRASGSFGTRFIPHISTYLNQRRWEEYIV